MLPYSSMWSVEKFVHVGFVTIVGIYYLLCDALTGHSIFFILNSFLLMNCRSAAWSHSSYSRDVSKLV